jgi:hypothetical protein
MDWIYRCEIFACLFLCPEKFFLQLNVYSDSIWSWSAQHWRGHEFAFGEIHGSILSQGNIFSLSLHMVNLKILQQYSGLVSDFI